MSPEKQLELLKRGTVQVVTEEGLLAKLRQSHKEKRPLRVKLGIDPSGSELTLGHAVALLKLKQFQDLGHQAVLIIGDYTGMVGDPTGRKRTRPALTHEETLANAADFARQAARVIDIDACEVVYNGEWFSKMTFADVIKLAGKMTVARMLERDDFQQRYRAGEPISIHEFLYSLMQGYDSVMVRADVELGATEQLFNLLVGRDLQRDAGQEEQAVITFPILVGTDGVRKMGKSENNYICLVAPPEDMFGKVMSIPDSLMPHYYELLTEVPLSEIEGLKGDLARGGGDPMEAKKRLAALVVARFHSDDAAAAAREHFERVFSRRELPEEMPEFVVPAEIVKDGAVAPVDLLEKSGLVPSRSQARRLVSQGAVSLDGVRVADSESPLPVSDGAVLRVGKRRFATLRLPR